MVKIDNQHASASGTTVLDISHASSGNVIKVTNTGGANSIFIDQGGNGTSINIDSEATSTPAIIVDIVDGDAHLRLTGDSGNATPTEGDFWRESDGLKYYDGTTEWNMLDISVAQLADGTDGELITWDAAGAPTTVAVGTATHVLTSNGAGAAPTFQAAAGGGASATAANYFVDQSGGTSDTYGVLAGTINGSNTTFTTSQTDEYYRDAYSVS